MANESTLSDSLPGNSFDSRGRKPRFAIGEPGLLPPAIKDPIAKSAWSDFQALAADIKLHHSVFALPWAILSTVLAAHRMGGLKIGQLVLIFICMVSARTVAMVANRILDVDFDKANPRTARRAMPSGRLSPLFMRASLAASAIVFFAAASGFWFGYRNIWPLALATPVLLFLVGYSLMKRYTRLCHYYLGAALALAPVCAWLAITGTVGLPPMLMFGAVLLWTAGFDILYACQDYAFDVESGLFSVPAKIGVGPALWVSRATHFCCVGFLVWLWVSTPELGILFGLGIGLATILLVIEHAVVKPGDLSRLNLAFFTLNGVISLTLGGLGVADTLMHH
jgi:4-hydroxybenzoate polyprenyltransferase